MNRILMVGAHFDDVELGAGGTAARLAAQGKEVYKLTLTDNVTKFDHMNVVVEYDSSAMQSRKACQVLGIHEIDDFTPIPCNHLQYNAEVMQAIENIIFTKKIDTVFFHFTHDMNQDHVEASRLCMTASRHCQNMLMFQSNLYIIDTPFQPNYFFDISNYITQKQEALAQYGAEHNRFSHMFQTTLEKNHVWGYANKVEYAEGFHVIKMLEK